MQQCSDCLGPFEYSNGPYYNLCKHCNHKKQSDKEIEINHKRAVKMKLNFKRQRINTGGLNSGYFS